MKKNPKKLSLNRETLTNLQLGKITGGIANESNFLECGDCGGGFASCQFDCVTGFC